MDNKQKTINGALLDYLEALGQTMTEDEKSAPMIVSGNRSISLSEMVNDVKNQTPEGKQFEQNIKTLTIDLLVRGKATVLNEKE